MNILAACGGPDSPVRKVVFKSSAHYYGCERDDPAFFTEAMQRPHPPRTRLESRHRRGRERRPRLRRAQHATSRSPSCASPTASGRTCAPRHRALLSLPAVPCILGFDPRYQFVHEDDIVGVLEHAVAQRPARASTTSPATACWRCRRSRACSASRSRRSCRRGGRAWPPRRCALAGVRIPEEMAQQLRYGRGLDNRKLKAAGLPPALHDARGGRAASPRTCACATLRAGRRRAIPLRARGRGVPALQPERAAPHRARAGRRSGS